MPNHPAIVNIAVLILYYSCWIMLLLFGILSSVKLKASLSYLRRTKKKKNHILRSRALLILGAFISACCCSMFYLFPPRCGKEPALLELVSQEHDLPFTFAMLRLWRRPLHSVDPMGIAGFDHELLLLMCSLAFMVPDSKFCICWKFHWPRMFLTTENFPQISFCTSVHYCSHALE